MDAGGDDYDQGGGGGYGGGEDEYGGGGGGGYGGDDYGGGSGGGEDTTPSFSMIDDVDGVAKFLAEEDTEPAVLGFFNAETHQADVDAFEAAAAANKFEWRFAYSTDDAVRKHFKSTGSRVDVYKAPRFVAEKYEKAKARYPGKSVDGDALVKFALKKALPLVGQKTWKSNDKYEKSGLPVLTLFVKVDLEKDAKGFDYYANRVRKVATDYASELLFNIGDKGDFSYLLEDYGLDLPGKKDIGVGIKSGSAHFAMAESFSVDNLRAFVAAWKQGELTPKIKEEPDYSKDAPDEGGADEEDDDGSPSEVVTLTTDNFATEVSDDKDVMVEFYAPWCGHCMQLKPTYKKLAAAFASVPSVSVAAMDATAHDVPPTYDVSGYPTIFFKKAGAKAEPYDGGRDLDTMVAFIKANAASKIADEL